MQNKCLQISELKLFSGITDQEVLRLCASAREEQFGTKGLVYVPKDFLDRLYFVETGEVTLYQFNNGKRVVFDTVSDGDMFGNVSTEPMLSTHYAEASPGTRILIIPINEFLKLIEKRPEIMLRTLGIIAAKLKKYEAKMCVSSGSASDKILAEIAHHNASAAGERTKLTHKRLAERTGLNRVTVTRTLQSLLKDKQIEKTGSSQYKVQA